VVHITAAPADSPVVSMLMTEGFDLISCPDARSLLEEVMHRQPDAVIYALRPDCREDLGVLRLMRRAAPDVPLVLLAAEDSLDTRRVTQTLRPIYYAVCPVDGAELRDVMRTAVARRGRVM
jgi:DNA-binding response OmpR family regulator